MVLISILLLGTLNSVHAAPADSTSPLKLHIKLADTTRAEPQGQTFRGEDAPSINSKLSKLNAKVTRPLFRENRAQLKAHIQNLRQQGHNLVDLSQYYEVIVPTDADPKKIVTELKLLSEVVEAYIAPAAAPSPTPNLLGHQGYRNNPPYGIGANAARSWPGAQGEMVTIADLEYSWNRNHEDLAKARAPGSLIAYGTPVDPFNNSHHGTMSVGVLSGTDNGFGITGIVPNSQLKLMPVNYQEYGYDLATAIYTTANILRAGDVMLIEQQTYLDESHRTTWMPIEWYPVFYDAIRYATTKGIIVIEPAGNGTQNLDTYGSPFPSGKSDSGAIMVGASSSCNPQINLRRLADSNYGTRVNLQGWGSCVTSAGWNGDSNTIWNSGENSIYTRGFAGTSSASAIIAGAAAALSSAYEKANGVAPSPSLVRSILMTHGTPQDMAVPGRIGPLPNLKRTLPASDLEKPTAPTALSSNVSKRHKPILRWRASRDNVAVHQYRIYRDSKLIKTLPASALLAIDDSAVTGKTYRYKVQAKDRAGRLSAYSNTATITVR